MSTHIKIRIYKKLNSLNILKDCDAKWNEFILNAEKLSLVQMTSQEAKLQEEINNLNL